MAADIAINLNRLPKTLRMLVETLGEALAFKLCQIRGGVSLYVPREISGEHWLNEALDPGEFARLVDAHGGINLAIPKYDALLMQLRHQRVVELHKAGQGPMQIALATGYTKRMVALIVSEIEADLALVGLPGFNDKQLDFFGFDDADTAPADDQADAEPTPTAHDPFGMTAGR